MGREGEAFSKQERECAYWAFLFLVMVAYLCIINKNLFLSGLEDSAIEFARALMSANGVLALSVAFVFICRCTDNANRAYSCGCLLCAFVGLIIFLNMYVFPSHLVPIEISKHDVIFPTTSPTERGNGPAPAPSAGPSGSEINKAVKVLDADITLGIDDLQNLVGFAFAPILLIAGFGMVMWAFRIDSSKAVIATFLLVVIGVFICFKTMVLDPHGKASITAAAEPLPLPATWVAPAYAPPATGKQPGQAEDGGSARLGALMRLRGVEAQLDNLLIRSAPQN